MTENKPSLAWLLRVIIGILLIFGFTAGYYWSHKPIELPAFVVLAQTIFVIIVWLIVIWIAAAIGCKFLPEDLLVENGIVYLALSAGLGLGTLSLMVFVLGILGLLSPSIAWLSLVILVALFRKQLRNILVTVHSLQLPKPENTLQKWIWGFGILMFAIAFIQALAPPTAWDSLLYHLAIPKLYIQAGQIGHPIDMFFLGYPALSTMQYTLALLLAGENTPALFHFAFGVLTLIVLVETAQRYFGKDVAWHAALVLISVPVLFNLIGLAYNDGVLLFYSTASIYLIIRWSEELNDRWLFPLGLLVGFSVSVKYTAFPIPLAITLILFWTSARYGLGATARRFSIVTISAIVVALPYYAENFITTGNPVYPLVFNNSIYWDAWRGSFLAAAGTGLASTSPLRLIIAPFEATVLGIDGAEGYGSAIGPLFFSSVFLLSLTWKHINKKEKEVLGHLLTFAGILYGFWLFGLARSALLFQTRFLMPAFGAMSILGGVGLARIKQLKRPQLEFRWLVNMALYINIAMLVSTSLFSFVDDSPIPVIAGLETRQSFLERRLGLYTIVIEKINQLPEYSRVLFLWEPRSYHCDIDCRPDALFDNIIHQTQYYKRDAKEIATDWQEQGITHILLFQAGLEMILYGNGNPITSEDLTILEQLQEEELELVEDFNGAYKLFKLDQSN